MSFSISHHISVSTPVLPTVPVSRSTVYDPLRISWPEDTILRRGSGISEAVTGGSVGASDITSAGGTVIGEVMIEVGVEGKRILGLGQVRTTVAMQPLNAVTRAAIAVIMPGNVSQNDLRALFESSFFFCVKHQICSFQQASRMVRWLPSGMGDRTDSPNVLLTCSKLPAGAYSILQKTMVSKSTDNLLENNDFAIFNGKEPYHKGHKVHKEVKSLDCSHFFLCDRRVLCV